MLHADHLSVLFWYKSECILSYISFAYNKIRRSDTMASLTAVDTTVNNRTYDYTEKDAFDALYQELAKGVQSMKNGEVYTIEQAWEKIDKI